MKTLICQECGHYVYEIRSYNPECQTLNDVYFKPVTLVDGYEIKSLKSGKTVEVFTYTAAIRQCREGIA